MKELFLVLATLITVGAIIPYLRDIFKGSTKPNLVSWITWTLLTGIATAAEVSAGENIAAIFTGASGLATALVVIVGLMKRAYVRYTRFDVICQISAVAGIILWQLFSSPVIAVLASVTIDFVGALPTIRHSYQKPHEETWITYAISSLGGLFGVLALERYDWVSLPYPLYIVIISLATAIVIVVAGRRRTNSMS